MAGRILVLNSELSGVNSFIFSQLEKRGWDISSVTVPFPRIGLIQAIYSSFTPNIFQWKYRCTKKIGKINKYPWTFNLKTRSCNKILKQRRGMYDLIFQISGMFAPTIDYSNLDKPYVTFNDYTVALSKKYPPWAPLPSHVQRWLELEKGLYENASFIFTTSNNTRNSFINDYGIKPEKVILVNYGTTLANIPDFSKTNDKKNILFVGKDFKRKGGHVLLEAFKKVRNEIKDAKLTIVGPSNESLKILQPGVYLIGYANDKEVVNQLYKDASVFVMPSYCEPFGLVFLEAMAYKLPCIGTSVDAIPEIIENEKTGFLVPPGDIDSLAEKIIKLLKDSDLSRKMGDAGYKRLNQKFQWDEFGAKIDFYLKKCL